MNINKETSICKEHFNDEFEIILKNIVNITKDYFSKENDYNTIKNPIEQYVLMYTSNKDRKYIANAIKGILYNYKISTKEIDNEIKKLNKLI